MYMQQTRTRKNKNENMKDGKRRRVHYSRWSSPCGAVALLSLLIVCIMFIWSLRSSDQIAPVVLPVFGGRPIVAVSSKLPYTNSSVTAASSAVLLGNTLTDAMESSIDAETTNRPTPVNSPLANLSTALSSGSSSSLTREGRQIARSPVASTATRRARPDILEDRLMVEALRQLDIEIPKSAPPPAPPPPASCPAPTPLEDVFVTARGEQLKRSSTPRLALLFVVICPFFAALAPVRRLLHNRGTHFLLLLLLTLHQGARGDRHRTCLARIPAAPRVPAGRMPRAYRESFVRRSRKHSISGKSRM